MTLLMKNFLLVFNMKKIFLLFLALFVLISSTENVYAEEKEQWEKDLNTCINQKKAASVHVTVDTSGSTESTDKKGLRGISSVAITLGLQKITKELQESEYENVDIEISWSSFAKSSKLVLPWTDLTTSNFTKQNLENFKTDMNYFGGDTKYLSALSIADQMFTSKNLQNSCEIWLFMTDGGPNDNNMQTVGDNFQALKSRGVFLIGVHLGEPEFIKVLQTFVGEISNYTYTHPNNKTSYTSTSTYLKSKVFLAEDATDILNAFLNITNNLRAASFNQERNELETLNTNICTVDQECFYELSVGVGTQTAIIKMNLSSPGNIGDVELYIEPPSALNVAENLKTIPPGGLNKTQFGDTKVEVEWYSEEIGIIQIDFDPEKNSWVGSWKFSLKAQDPQNRTVDWTTELFTNLVPKIPKNVPLRIGQEQCVDISYLNDAPPLNADVKLLVINPSDGSILKSIKAVEIPRGHRACITPDDSLPSKVKLQTEVIYEPSKGKKAYADVASSEIIEILEAPKYNKITGPLNSDKQVFKGEQSVKFEFEVEAGNIDSVINVVINQLSSNLSPNVNWTIEYKGNKYKLGTEDFPIKIRANENEILTLIGDPYEAVNLDNDTMYEVVFKSSIPTISAVEDVISIQINSRFLDVPLFDIVKYAVFIFLIFLLVGLISSYLYSSFNSGLVFDKNIRTKSYLVSISREGIDWFGDNFYNDTFDNTRILSSTAKKVSLGNSIKIQFKQKVFPFIQDSSAEIYSRDPFVSIYNKEFENKKNIKNDINKIWVFELESSTGEKITGNLTIVANNEQTFNLLKEEAIVLQNIDYSSTPLSPNVEKDKNIEQGVSDVKTDDGPDTDSYGGTPPGPPPPPGSGGPPPPPGSGGPPPPPGSGGPPPPPS